MTGKSIAAHKTFIKVLESIANRYSVNDVFSDVCGMMASAIEKPMSTAPDECENRYLSIARKYSRDEIDKVVSLLAIVVDALEENRESFLGPVLEEIGAANVHNGQFLTPQSVASLCGRITADRAETHVAGELVTMNDPACGAGVLLISGAEEMLSAGIPQRDIFLIGGDVDIRACDITFIELSLLGYSARIDHANALTMRSLSRSRWTPGYYLHGTRWRETAREIKNRREKVAEQTDESHTTDKDYKQVEFAL